VNPNCPAHSRYSLGNIWHQKQRDIELKIAFMLIFLALALREALLLFEPYMRTLTTQNGL